MSREIDDNEVCSSTSINMYSFKIMISSELKGKEKVEHIRP